MIPGVTGSPNGIQTFSRAAGQMRYQGYYVTDTFQITQKLTLNYGLRWDIASPYTERYDRQSVLLPDAVSPLAKLTGLPIKGALALVNSPEIPSRGSQKLYSKLFAPRLGFAYRLTNKTVIRSGYGIYYLPNDATFNLSPHNHPINQIITPWVATLDGGLTPFATLSNPFPNGLLQPPARDPSYQSSLYGKSISSPVFDQPYPYMQQWNLNVQRELPWGTVIDVAYAGSRGVHLLASGQQLNQLPDQYMALGTQLQKQVPNPFYGLITTGTLSAPNVAQGQLLLPYPQYTGVSIISASNRDSSYHSMQMKMEKRFRSGGTVMAAYTVSKIISTAETLTGWLDSTGTMQFNNNLRLERSLLGTDVPQRLVMSYVLDLPVGKGQALLGNVRGITDRLISGWGLNGVSTFQKGFPLALTTNVNLTNSFGGGSRPNVVKGCDKMAPGSAQDRIAQWFNASCFSQPPAFTFGTESRTDPQLRTHGIANYDLALFKNIPLTERVGVQFRTEVFNLFNRVQFGNPGVAVGNPTFGVITSQANNPRLVQFALRLQY